MTEFAETSGPRRPLRRAVEAVVGYAIAKPWTVIFLSLALIAAANVYIRAKLELKSDFLELLPRDSPGFIAFEHQLHRVGGGATLFVVVESPDRAANEKFVDDLSAEVKKIGPDLVSYVEDGSKEVREFYKANKWLYADLKDLEEADTKLDNQIAIKSGLVENLEGDDDAPKKPAAGAGDAGAADAGTEHALGMDQFKKRWDDAANKHDDFPTGYFATPDGTMLGIRIVSPTTGTGDRGGDVLLQKVKDIVAGLNIEARNPSMRVGYAGDIPNAIAEKESIVSEAATATAIATFLVLFGVFAFFRSFSAVFVMLLPAALGVACAYTFATATFGYVNTSGAFLGAIILGNGINYPIVLLGRYREFTARGMTPDVAKKAAVWNAFRAELVGACVAGIAYGSLTITRFRGFSQFGMIGFVGMLLVWISIIPLVPAVVTVFERQRDKPGYHPIAKMRDAIFNAPVIRSLFPEVKADGSRGEIINGIAKLTERYPRVIIAIALVLTGIALVKIPGFLKDPWEYNFAHLGSKES
jgi:predicted RND superfamily exporter protein